MGVRDRFDLSALAVRSAVTPWLHAEPRWRARPPRYGAIPTRVGKVQAPEAGMPDPPSGHRVGSPGGV